MFYPNFSNKPFFSSNILVADGAGSLYLTSEYDTRSNRWTNIKSEIVCVRLFDVAFVRNSVVCKSGVIEYGECFLALFSAYFSKYLYGTYDQV